MKMAQHKKLNRPNAKHLKLKIPKDDFILKMEQFSYPRHHKYFQSGELSEKKSIIHDYIDEETGYGETSDLLSDSDMKIGSPSILKKDCNEEGEIFTAWRHCENEPKKSVTFLEHVDVIPL